MTLRGADYHDADSLGLLEPLRQDPRIFQWGARDSKRIFDTAAVQCQQLVSVATERPVTWSLLLQAQGLPTVPVPVTVTWDCLVGVGTTAEHFTFDVTLTAITPIGNIGRATVVQIPGQAIAIIPTIQATLAFATPFDVRVSAYAAPLADATGIDGMRAELRALCQRFDWLLEAIARRQGT